ncbi:MAG TPA: lamin tail domain-containing protein [Bacteroidales bacterium]|nr:lamin tail domain-containing protein [Bacteroidales bacterium]
MKLHFFLFLFITCHLSGQLTENFENSDISGWNESASNRWEISSERPISGNHSLHHAYDNSESDHDQIALLHDPLILDSAITIWRFTVRHEYDPSASNHWAAFLVSDKSATGMNPGGKCSGYILGVNYTGSDDLIKFWKSENNVVSEIMSTGFNWQSEIGTDKSATFEIIRHQNGRWNFYIDTATENSDKIKLGEVVDPDLKISYFFGLYYKYSSAQDRKLWFDDLYLNGFFLRDTLPPSLQAAMHKEQRQLVLQFNELITFTSESELEITANSESIGIDSMEVSDNNLHIWLKLSMMNETGIAVKTYRIRDIYGNTSFYDSIMLFYYLPGFNDLIITEIMADPFPAVSLPEAEYLEIYNRSKYTIDLNDWHICAGSNCAAFDAVSIFSDEYMILFDSHYPEMFSGLSRTLAMDHFPKISNTGQTLVLKDNHSNIIFTTEYHVSWYQDNYKSDGGWSLELIDPGNPCGGEKNWKASIDASGGTPGNMNSVMGENPDIENPELLKSVLISDSTLYLNFSETVTGEHLYSANNYYIDNGIGTPYLSIPGSDLLNSVILFFDQHFEDQVYYSIKIKNDLSDCAGNMTESEILSTFRKPLHCDSMDLIINEILFDPYVTGGEFIEVYNRSLKTIDLKDFYITLRDTYSGKQGPSYLLSESHYTLEPGYYLVLTGNISLVTDYYRIISRSDFLEMDDIPNLPNTGAFISLLDPADHVIDEVVYSQEMHVEFASNTKGVSLERINPDGSSCYPGNWYSASGDFGYATPGYENSQYRKDLLSSFSVIAVPEIITPDADGINDAAIIKYVIRDAGYIANIMIFDRTGRPVKIIARNVLLGSSGEFLWDGKNDEGRMAPVGPYLIYAEIFNLSGDIKRFKNSCIIAEKIY